MGEWIFYNYCTKFGDFECPDNSHQKREEDVSFPSVTVATTILSNIDDSVKSALAKENDAKEVINKKLESLKDSSPDGEKIKIMDPSEIDFSKLESVEVVDKVAILEGDHVKSA